MKLSFSKTIWLEIGLIALLIAGYFTSDMLAYVKKQNIRFTEQNGCELNQKDCELVIKDNSRLIVSVEPKIITPLQAAKFIVKNDGANEVKVISKGLNMNMGVHEHHFKKVSEGVFEASILLPSCSLAMKWQIDVIISKDSGEYGGSFILWSKN